ncbi:MAG: phosphoadenylyl-sulfate reductase [Acidobacteriota bacterium]
MPVITRDDIPEIAPTLRQLSQREILLWAIQSFGDKVAFSSSLGVEDQVLTHVIAESAPSMRIFTLDTGRLFPETYNLIEQTENRYRFKFEVYCPDATEVEAMVREHGINLFYRSTDLRKLCCGVRKINPLRRALRGLEAWITGLRRAQSVTRQEADVLEWDAQNDLIKINPLWKYTDQEVWDFVRSHDIPYNPLHNQGFLSIGCSCCTRAVRPGEDVRAGRWWWESPEHRECGLHLSNGKLVPTRATVQ